MPTVIPVKFTYVVRDLWFDPAESGAQEADHVICQTERGVEIGLATADAREVDEEELANTIGHSQLREVLRIATDEDLDRADELARRGDEAMPTFRRLVSASGLDMKPVGVEYLLEGEKAVCYFAAEDRVDFRQLVRDLSRELHVRIDMRQIGVREEASIVGGWGHCGQELCCRRFNMSFDPVSIRMAKEQDLPLNSTKISGACGRLMCCLRYEFEAYRDFKGRAPKRNAVIDTPLGKGKIIEYDTPKEQICLRLENGKQIRVALADMTASEAAVKKSEDLGCACRPDTVSREVLDRLQSPDVQMALAELDRKNGVTPNETFDESDLFVETKHRRKRSGGGQSSGGSGSGKASGGSGSEAGAESSGTRRRHKRRSSATGDGASEGAAAPQDAETGASGSGSGSTTRRRRHHHTEGDVMSSGGQGSGSGKSGSGRSGGNGGSNGNGGGSRRSQGQGGSGSQGGGAKRTRHPGDKGGKGSGGQQGGGQGQGGQQRSKSSSGNGQGGKRQQQGGGQQQGGDAAKSSSSRRRRRRGGRGKGGHGSEAGSGGSGGAQGAGGGSSG